MTNFVNNAFFSYFTCMWMMHIVYVCVYIYIYIRVVFNGYSTITLNPHVLGFFLCCVVPSMMLVCVVLCINVCIYIYRHVCL